MSSIFWADKIAKEIIDSGSYKPLWVDDMFTPSGFAHIGSLRGPIVHDLVYRALSDTGEPVTFTYIFNDFDPVDGLPPELMEAHKDSLGLPLRIAPSPDPAYSTFAEYFTVDFQNVLRSLGLRAEFLSSWDMYRDGKFNGVIREALDHADVIQDIYQRVSGSQKREKGWLPLQVICEKCGKLGTTRVHNWDGETVAYTCEPAMVTWAQGCGYTGRISPFDGKGKLPWKVDWPAHWKVLGVTIEGAGKDHSSAGGSRDIAKELCNEVFHYPNPYNLPYEFFLIGGKKMSSSKGLGLKARDLTGVLPASVGRFLFARTDYRQAIEFDPVGTMAIPDLFDEYDRCWQAFISPGDEVLARVFELSQIDQMTQKSPTFIPRFRDIANYLQQASMDLQKKFEDIKGDVLTVDEQNILTERMQYAKVWIEKFAPEEYRLQLTETLPEGVHTLSVHQKQFLYTTAQLLVSDRTPDDLQLVLYQEAKKLDLHPKDAFAAIYMATLGKPHGPRAAWFLQQYPANTMRERLLQAAEADIAERTQEGIHHLDVPEYIQIDTAVRRTYPSISVGVAIIRGVTITKTDPNLEKEKQVVLDSLSDITTEKLGTLPEVVSYRKLYKAMGIDWHSRRPSPEALLRRVALGKGLYSVNTCVDAYNLVVMKSRVSVGAFDLDMVEFPTVLRFAGEGDEILLLGDTEPTRYKASEIAYYDKTGGYNIDFNFRDAQRTRVTPDTKNIWINVDGVYDIPPEQVKQTLHEAVQKIVQYCGGTVEVEGVVL